MSPNWIVFTIVIAITLLMVLSRYFQFRIREELQETLRLGLQAQNGMTPDTIKSLVESANPPLRDLRRGIVSISFGIAWILLGLAANELSEGIALKPMLAISSFPILVGIAYLILWRIGNNQQNRSQDSDG